MQRRSWCFSSLLACALVAACGSDEPTATDLGAVAVVVAFDRSSAVPGDTVNATVTATPTGGARIRFITFSANGLITRTDSLAIASRALTAQSATQRYVLPADATGTLRLTAVAGASARTGSAETALIAVDTIGPRIDSTWVVASARQDTVRVILRASDNAGIAAVVVRFSGAFALRDSTRLGYPRSLLDTASYVVPAGADRTEPLGVAVHLWDVGGQQAHSELRPFQLENPQGPEEPAPPDTLPPPVDGAPPVIGSALLTPDGLPVLHLSAAAYLPGEQVTVRLAASDDVRLARMGYRIGAPVNLADSIAVDSVSASATRTFTVLPSWRGVAAVTFFAVDAAGRRTEVAAPPMSVYAVVPRPIRGAEIPGAIPGGGITDAVFDAKRRVVYLAQPDSNRVLVLSTATMTFGAPIAIPRAPMGLDLTPGGDSLVIALRRTHAIGVIDLTSAAPAMDTLHIEVPYWMAPSGPGPTSQGPGQVRVTSRGEAFIRFNLDGTGFTPLWMYDIAARRQRHRADGGLSGLIFDTWTIATSGDRARTVIFQDCLICIANIGQIHDAASDTFGPRVNTTQTYGAFVSLDQRGERVLIASTLFDRDLAFLHTFAPPGFDLSHKRMHGTTPTLIDPGGDLAFISIKDDAYYLVRTSDGGVLEKVLLPASTKRLLIVDGGNALLAIGLTAAARSRVDLVDLR